MVVTEKDAPKLAAFEFDYWVLRIDLHFLGAEPDAAVVGLA